MLVIAHRGANKEGLENSWDAFGKAVAAGAVRIELDVQLTRDGHAVINHDDALTKTTGLRQRISRLDRAELSRIRLLNGEPVPFLDEALERLLPAIELNIEIKGESEKLADVVAKLVAQHPRRERIIVSCFQAKPLVWMKYHAPAVQRACLWSSDSFNWPFFATLAPSVFLAQASTNILHPHTSLVDANLMDQAAARNWRVYAWAEMVGEDHGRDALWTTLRTFGLHGLCTNYPRELKLWLEEAERYDRLVHD